MSKLQHLVEGRLAPFDPAPTFARQSTRGVDRLSAFVCANAPHAFESLVRQLEPPYYLLYVLHTPRGEGHAGRYQCPAVTAEEFSNFMAKFSVYLNADARFDFWAHSPAEQATVVWDRHQQLFCYGPIDRFAECLKALGYTEGDLAHLGEHVHHYRAECDAMAASILRELDWSHSALRPEDEQ